MTNLPWDSVPTQQQQPGVFTRRLDLTQMTVVEYRFEPEASFPIHHHEEEQLVVILSGTAHFTVGEETVTLTAGESIHAAPHVPHGCRSGSDGCRFLNILAPRRRAGSIIHYASAGDAPRS